MTLDVTKPMQVVFDDNSLLAVVGIVQSSNHFYAQVNGAKSSTVYIFSRNDLRCAETSPLWGARIENIPQKKTVWRITPEFYDADNEKQAQHIIEHLSNSLGIYASIEQVEVDA